MRILILLCLPHTSNLRDVKRHTHARTHARTHVHRHTYIHVYLPPAKLRCVGGQVDFAFQGRNQMRRWHEMVFYILDTRKGGTNTSQMQLVWWPWQIENSPQNNCLERKVHWMAKISASSDADPFKTHQPYYMYCTTTGIHVSRKVHIPGWIKT